MNIFLRRLITAALLMSVLMTVLSAYIRLSDSGIGCEPWPACTNLSISGSPGITIAADDTNKYLRVLHRITASVFGVVAIVLCVVSAWYRKSLDIGPMIPGAVLLLTVVLAIVGMNTPDVLHPIIATLNISGGMLLTAMLYDLYMSNNKPNVRRNKWLLATAAVVYLTIVSGAWVSANFVGCQGNCPMTGDPAHAFHPDRELNIDQFGHIIADGQDGIIMAVHVWLSIVVAMVIIILAYQAFPVRSQDTAIYLIILGCLMIPGFVSISSVHAAHLHNFFSLLLLLRLVHHMHRGAE